MRKRWIQYMLPLGAAVGLFSSCEYNDIMKAGLDEAKPRIVAPVLYDTLTVEEMANRRGEPVAIRYEGPEQIAYLFHADTMRLGAKEMMLKRQHSRVKSSNVQFTLGLPITTGFRYSVDLTFKIFERADLSQVILTSQTFDVVLKLKEPLPVGFEKLSAKLKFADIQEVTRDFTLSRDAEVRIPVGYIANDREFSLRSGSKLNNLEITLLDFKVDNALPGSIEIEAAVEATGITVQKAWGVEYLAFKGVSPRQLVVKADAFATTVLADQSLPGVEIGVDVHKDNGSSMKFAVQDLRGHNLKSVSFPEEGIQIMNSGVPVGDGALNVMDGEWNELDYNKTFQQFLLNASNSNIEEPFAKGANLLKFGKLEMEGEVSTVDRELHLGPRKLDLVRWVKVPMDGWARSNLMRSELDVDPFFFESTSNALQGFDKDGVKLEDIFLCFYTYNAIPLDVYARFTFLDKNRQPIYTLQFDNEGNPKVEGLSLLGKSGTVEGRFVGKAGETYHEVKVSREDYDKLANSAVKVVAEYLFRSADVGNSTRVALRKQDFVRVNIALRLSGNVSILKDR